MTLHVVTDRPGRVILEGRGITKHFAGLAALVDVDFTIDAGAIVGLIGPNGAGKTTLFGIITGLHPPSRGTVTLDGVPLTGRRPHEICRRGVARTFQTPRFFPDMTVRENVLLAAVYGGDGHAGTRTPDHEARRVLDFVGLATDAGVMARRLPPLKRKILEIAAALATRPRVLLIDEVLAGLTPAEMADVVRLIASIRTGLHVTVFWIEHVMKALMEAVDWIIVLHHGTKIAEGEPAEIARDERVLDAYLGEKHA